MSQTPKEEVERVLNVLLPFAEQQLIKYGEFYPFAAAMRTNGDIMFVATHNGNENPSSQQVIDEIKSVFTHEISENRYRATGLAYMVGIRNVETGEKEDAVSVQLDHIGGYSVVVSYPYLLKKKLFRKNTVDFRDPFVSEGRGEVF